jgi:hypothetical protein
VVFSGRTHLLLVAGVDGATRTRGVEDDRLEAVRDHLQGLRLSPAE